MRFPPTALHAVVIQQKNTRLPASGSGCDSRPPLRSNAAGTTLANASKEARRFKPSREQKLSKSLRPLSTFIDSSECRRSYFFEKDGLRRLLSLRFSLRSSVEAGPHKPACEGSTPSAAKNVPESSNGRTRGFDPRDEGSNPSSGADNIWVWLNLARAFALRVMTGRLP